MTGRNRPTVGGKIRKPDHGSKSLRAIQQGWIDAYSNPLLNADDVAENRHGRRKALKLSLIALRKAMTAEFKRVLIKWPSSHHNDLLADCHD